MPSRVRIIGIYDNPAFSAPIEYAFDLLFSVYGINYRIIPLNEFKPEEYNFNEILAISYGKEYVDVGFIKHIHIYSSDFFGTNYLKLSSMPQVPLERYEDLPVIYTGSGNLDGWVKRSESLIETNIDIIASSFFMVSRYEELIIDTRDKHDRFPATASLACQEGFLDRPIVNEYIELLWRWIQALAPDLKRGALWKEKKDFVCCLTHDVDSLRRYSFTPPVLRMGSAILKKRNPRLALKILLEYIASLLHTEKDPHNTFDYMLNMEQNYRLKSSFYFMSDEGSYDINETDAIGLIRKIEAVDCEVGLHASYNSYNDFEKMALEKVRLDKIIGNKSYGCRQHFLRWKTPDTWRIQEQLGILYDSTLSYADHAGFRCGICLPFKPFDIIENRTLDIWELPLIVMEGSLQNPDYQGLPPQAAYEEMIKLCDTVRKFNGVFVLLWHNSSFDSLGGWEGWKAVYENLLEYIGKQAAWSASGREIIEWRRSLQPID